MYWIPDPKRNITKLCKQMGQESGEHAALNTPRGWDSTSAFPQKGSHQGTSSLPARQIQHCAAGKASTGQSHHVTHLKAVPSPPTCHGSFETELGNSQAGGRNRNTKGKRLICLKERALKAPCRQDKPGSSRCWSFLGSAQRGAHHLSPCPGGSLNL